jgi:hypothetical protein
MNKSSAIQKFILDNVENHPGDIAIVLAKKFGFSRQRAHQYLIREVENGNIIKTGRTRWTRYFLAGGKYIKFIEKIKPGIAEDRVWIKYIKPMVLSYPENIYRICAYGFTEIFNNAIDHSKGTTIITEIGISNNTLNPSSIYQKVNSQLIQKIIQEREYSLPPGCLIASQSFQVIHSIHFKTRIGFFRQKKMKISNKVRSLKWLSHSIQKRHQKMYSINTPTKRLDLEKQS